MEEVESPSTAQILKLHEELVEHSPEPMAVIDGQYRFRVANPAFGERYGKCVSEIVGCAVAELVGKEPFERWVRPHLGRSFAGEAHCVEGWFTYPTVGCRLVEVHFYPLCFDDEARCSAVVVRDVTERREAEDALRHQLEIDRAIAEISARFAGTADLDTAINASLADMGRLSCAIRAYLVLLRKDGTATDNTHEWCADGTTPQIEMLQNIPISATPWAISKLQAGETINVPDVSRLPPEAGAERELLEMQEVKSALCLPVTIGGRFAGFIGLDNVMNTGEWNDEAIGLLRVCSEIVGNALERRRIAEALRESEARFRLLAEQAQDIIYLYRLYPTPSIDYVSPAVTQILGYRPEEYYADPDLVHKLVHPEDRSLLNTTTKSAVASGAVIELRWTHRDGRLIWTEHRNTPIYDEAGSLVAVEGVARDITERKEAELLRAQYLSFISHDLRAPVSVVVGHASLLRMRLSEHGLDREAARARSILESGWRMNSMIQDLMESTRLESGLLDCQRESVDICRMALDLCRRMEVEDGQSRLRVECASGVSLAAVDREQIERVMSNLITNALKYSPPGSPVTVKVASADGEVTFCVVDRGDGIPAEEIPRLFDRFYRAARVRKTDGLGLGLYISRLIVEAHGGRIWAESQPGAGNIFGFSLPAGRS